MRMFQMLICNKASSRTIIIEETRSLRISRNPKTESLSREKDQTKLMYDCLLLSYYFYDNKQKTKSK